MKTIWKGGISFGLVNIPIKLYTATESHALGFTLLHAKCHTPLKYHRWCPKCEQEVLWEETIKGLETDKDNYLVLTKELLAKLKPEKSEKIEVLEFIDEKALDPLYFNHQYYVTPDKKNDSAFALFSAGLNRLGKIAIGKFTMRDKEYVCALRPYKNYLLLITLHYAHEIKNIEALEFHAEKVTLASKEVELAEELINKLSVKKFDMSQFKDTFAQKIKELVKANAAGKKTKIAPKKTTRKKEGSLMESLRASLEEMPIKPKARITKQPVAYAGPKTIKKTTARTKAKTKAKRS